MVKVIKMYPGIADRHNIRYIGRGWAGYSESIFQNPFHLRGGHRTECLLKFIVYWYAPEQLWLRKEALKLIGPNDTLGCWCKPLGCHGDIIAGYVNWKLAETQMGFFL